MKNVVFFVVIVSTLSILGTANADTEVGGWIFEDTTWVLAGSPYIVTSPILVDGAATLTISAGVEVKLNTDMAITVFGEMVATGTESQKIWFHSSDELSHWAYIKFNGSCHLEHCLFERGGSSDVVPAAIHVEGGGVIIRDSIIRNNAHRGLYVTEGTTVIIERSEFSDNTENSGSGGGDQLHECNRDLE